LGSCRKGAFEQLSHAIWLALIGKSSKPQSRTRALSGKSIALRRGSFGDRFSSKSNFMRDDVQAAVTVCGERKARLNVMA